MLLLFGVWSGCCVRRIQSVITLTKTNPDSFALSLDFNPPELPVPILVLWIVAQRVVRSAIGNPARNRLAEIVDVVKSAATGLLGQLFHGQMRGVYHRS